MPLSDQTRIDRDRMVPRIVALWQALAPLKSVVSFMNTGAHPDDETTAMLAALGFRDGVDLSYACSTRGEGGQNDIGREATEALGVVRTAEMERACDVLNMRMYWLSEAPDDTIFDFGFSKSGVETMGKWGRKRTLKRFVDILRMEKPDIICPTFLNIPGQHGHHRAMTEAAHLVMDLCGDAGYGDSDLAPWQVKKLYLPAWSGAGQSYDDDLPPPPSTLEISADGIDPVTGFSFERIGQQSRAYHKTQGMGRWMPAGSERNWPLHLADSRVEGPDDSLFAGLPQTLRELGLADAQDHIDAALAAFPDFDAVLNATSQALATLNGSGKVDGYDHKIERKRDQLARVIRIAAGVEAHAHLSRDILQAGDRVKLHADLRKGAADDIQTEVILPAGWTADNDALRLDAPELSNPYPSEYFPDAPRPPYLALSVSSHGIESLTRIGLEVPPQIVPARSVTVSPLSDVINLKTGRREIDVALSNVTPQGALPEIIVPSGWTATRTDAGFHLTAPRDAKTGRYTLPITLDGQDAQSVQIISHPHIDPRSLARPAMLQIQIIGADLPQGKTGYLGGGHDRVGHWMTRMGVDASDISDTELQSDAALAQYDSIVIGIFAMKSRAGLAEQMRRLHDWVKAGGTLVTLYHRPWDNWDAHATPPARLEIGQPSLRSRVTDETSAVTHLADHPVLTIPNAITDQDWAGWHKERGLYFAKSWDAAYMPLLEMADADEDPHRGALLSADIGQGRHIHCALILHHQMEKLVPGAFRLMANLLTKR